jgi:hypothetical protein
LKRCFGITPVITEAVEGELFLPSRKEKNKHVQAQAQKALDNGALVLLDERSLGAFTFNDPHTTYISIQIEGQKNNLHLGKGESFSHAVGVILRIPILSNDSKALLTADRLRLSVAKPTLRAYDLFVLLHQIGELTENDCDEIRKSLLCAGEVPHADFCGRKFSDGLLRFYPRVVAANYPILATGKESELGDIHRLQLHTNTPRKDGRLGSPATLGDVWPKGPGKQ